MTVWHWLMLDRETMEVLLHIPFSEREAAQLFDERSIQYLQYDKCVTHITDNPQLTVEQIVQLAQVATEKPN